MAKRFKDWQYPTFSNEGMTKWNWMCQYDENLILGEDTDIGAFTYINAKYGVEIQKDAQIGSHCSIYSESTIDRKKGQVLLKENCRIGSHSVLMPGVTVGRNSTVGAFSFVNQDIPANVTAVGVPARIANKNDTGEKVLPLVEERLF